MCETRFFKRWNSAGAEVVKQNGNGNKDSTWNSSNCRIFKTSKKLFFM